MLRSLNEISGYNLEATDGDIGECRDFLFDDTQWTIRYMVADTHKWLPGGRKVLISPISLGEPRWANSALPVNLTREEIKNSPSIDEHKPVSRQYEAQFFRYYGYGFYWMGGGLWGTGPHPAALVETAAPALADIQEDEDEHLRSASEIEGYTVNAKDDSIGHVENFILQDETWEIAYLVIATRNWLPGGRKVLISPHWLTDIDWKGRSVSVNLTTEQIKNSPEYHSVEFADPVYEDTLHSHYGLRKRK
ncbi:PRC-barrel domain-containing protein [Saccharophagus degradans]|uniref:PRC-barrel domain-containing protein n=1 Tax=Saccharophagus degradans TaxID=86304 RepID=UPI001C08E15D|nr:PRC-barrel domain-containing protein [Saccharophagus degradans]MBU2985655.1 PRC-barrel domain-containing protein [Saccharophagus degradans]